MMIVTGKVLLGVNQSLIIDLKVLMKLIAVSMEHQIILGHVVHDFFWISLVMR